MPAYMFLTNDTRKNAPQFVNKINSSINKTGKLCIHAVCEPGLLGAVSYVAHNRLSREHVYSSDGIYAWFTGYLVDHAHIPWHEIVNSVGTGDYAYFEAFKAPFAVAIYYKKIKKAFLVSDMFSQFPVFYSLVDQELLISTHFSTFIETLCERRFDDKWLTDFFIFNLSVGEKTPLKNVKRMLPACVLCADLNNGSLCISSYAAKFKSNIPDCSEKDIKKKTYALFQERIPKYYTLLDAGPYAASITSGFDSRVCVSFAPDETDLHLYTYGQPECEDMKEAEKIASVLGYPHHSASFGVDDLENLYDLACRTIDYSGGQQSILRSNLSFVYHRLSDMGLNAVITGINGDHFYRSFGVTPYTLSVAIAELVKNPEYVPFENSYFFVFKDKQKNFENFQYAKEFFEKNYSWSSLSPGERLLTYNNYELGPKYFGSEFTVADNFVLMVSPFWDADIRLLAYNSNLSTLTLNKFIYDKFPHWKYDSLFSYILSKHPKFQSVPVHKIKPKYYAPGNKYVFYLAKALFRGPGKILNKFSSKADIPLEPWDRWQETFILPKFTSYFSEFLLENYISADVIKTFLKAGLENKNFEPSFHLMSKIITAELVLRYTMGEM
ncbi:hypothetical protein LJC22_00460 [Desulfosarcina sp. OttesenSCG-928-G10]|nr:hypothetical protein [Desulfosarcina sp. OttesenSCG-928-G10]MDL2321190.1 hypothetical protein [Desulfosarcina sp. OttesenSCG-928-B08]